MFISGCAVQRLRAEESGPAPGRRGVDQGGEPGDLRSAEVSECYHLRSSHHNLGRSLADEHQEQLPHYLQEEGYEEVTGPITTQYLLQPTNRSSVLLLYIRCCGGWRRCWTISRRSWVTRGGWAAGWAGGRSVWQTSLWVGIIIS